MNQIVFYDQIGARKPVENFVVDWNGGAACTLRDLIGERVRLERRRFEDAGDRLDLLLYAPRIPVRDMSPDEAVSHALDAFVKNAFMVMVDGRQVTDLDAAVVVSPRTEVRFIRLVPLKGG